MAQAGTALPFNIPVVRQTGVRKQSINELTRSISAPPTWLFARQKLPALKSSALSLPITTKRLKE